MPMKTNFSFELYYADASTCSEAQRDQVMRTLEPSLHTLFAASDSAVKVSVSDSHKGSTTKLVELVSTLPDQKIAQIFKDFCDANGVTVSAIE